MKMSFIKFMLMMALMKLPKVIDAKETTTATTVTFFKPSTRATTTTTTTTSTTSTTKALGCMDKKACNYDENAQADDESCRYVESPNHDCDGRCKVEIDECGVCGGKGTGEDRSKCAKEKFREDNYCDDGNNNCACGWDGGDCCGNHPKKNHFCKECKCLDPIHVDDQKKKCGGKCMKAHYKGDKYCDDVNNNCGCQWDGGDCCGRDNTYTYCNFCLCLDPDFKASEPSKKDDCSPKCTSSCRKPKWVNDTICDDQNNHCGCNWDGGDCCGPDNNYKHCTDCQCRDCGYKHETDGCVDKIKGYCVNPKRKGDGFCDDANNIAGCAWDGGDCCGKSVYTECSKCECLDCNYKIEKPEKDECTKWIRSKCAKPVYKGDGYCDDNNNVAGCDWDGGDCCGKHGRPDKFTHCKDCKCLDCTYEKTKNGDECVAEAKKPCQAFKWSGDKTCDDGNNHAGCNWDGGDCCGKFNDYTLCKDCKCLDCTHKEEPLSDPCIKGKQTKGITTCAEVDYIGDGFCDDGNNNAYCTWDGGDCCGKSGQIKQYDYCKDCECKDCTHVPKIVKCTGKQIKDGGGCKKPNWVSDTYCDSENNNGGCNWDGGDCCLPHADSKKFCKKDDPLCVCLDCSHEKKCPNEGDKQKKCEQLAYKGDGICDNGNNNCVCGWDGGDCCGKDNDYTYCGTECKCFDPRVKCGGICRRKKWFKDGICDPDNNNCGCGWDGGDCCGLNGKETQYAYCKLDCYCKDKDLRVFSAKRGHKCNVPCGNPDFRGDATCDDDNNTCGCGWDEGDCCISDAPKLRCKACECIDPFH